MAKFKVLDIRTVLCQRMGIIPTSIITPPYAFCRLFADHFVWGFLFISTVSSILYVSENYEDLNGTLKTVPMIIGAIQSIGMFMGIGIRSSKIATLRDKVQTLVDKVDENSEIHKNYWKREQCCRKFTERLSRYVHTEQLLYSTTILRSIYLVLTGEFDASKLTLPYNMALPFDADTVWGWYLYCFLSASIAFSFSSAMIPITSFFVSCSYYITAICEHIGLLAESIDKNLELRRMGKNRTKWADNRQIHEIYSEIVNIHVDLFEIFNLIASIFSGAIFALLPLMALYLAMEMYTMENCSNSFNAVSIGFSIVCVFVGTLWSAVFSIYSSRGTDHIEEIGETAYNMQWFDLPLKEQKFTILVIARSQEPINFTGLGLIYCNLEAFANIANSAVSYYLVFRGLSNM